MRAAWFEHVHGVDADVAFGMPLGVLRDAEEICDFGEVSDPAGGLQIFADAAGVCALYGPLHELFGDALTGEGRVLARNGTRHGGGGRFDCQVEAAGELHSAQDAQRVLGKSIAGGAQDAIVQVDLAAEEVPDFADDGVEAHGVDGEVAAGGGFARGDGFLELGVKIAVAGAGLAVAAGDAEVARDT